MQPVRKLLAPKRATAGLAVANLKEHNNVDDRFPGWFGGRAPQNRPVPRCSPCKGGGAHSLRTAPCLGLFGTLCILSYLIEGVLA